MKAVVLSPGTTTLRLADVPEPRVSTAEEVKVRVLRVGICGTDREEAWEAGPWHRRAAGSW